MSVKSLRYFEPVLDLRPVKGFRAETVNNLRWRVGSFIFDDDKTKHNTSQLVLDNYDGKLFDINSIGLGILMKISFGYPGALCAPKLMQSRKINGAVRYGGLGPESGNYTTAGGLVTLKLHSTVWNMNVQRAAATIDGEFDRHLVLQSTTVPAAARTLAQKYGFTTANTFIETWPDEEIIESSSIPIKFSSYEWLRDHARKRDWVFDVDSDGFHFHSDDYEPVAELNSPEKLSWFAGEPDVLSWEIDGDLTVPQAIQTKGTKNEISTKAFKSSAELGQGIYTPYGIRSYNEAPSLTLTGTTNQRQLEKIRRIISKSANAWKLKLELVGNPYVRRGKLLDLYNFGPMVDGVWRVKKSIHKIEPNKVYTTEIEATRRQRGSRSTTVKLVESRKELGETKVVPITLQLSN